MLKLFFSDSLPERRIEIVRAMRGAKSASSRSCARSSRTPAKGRTGSYLTLQLGIASTEAVIEWCEATERRLAAESEEE